MTSPSTVLATCRVALADRSYDVRIGQGLLSDAAAYADLPRSRQGLIVTNTTVGPLYGAALKSALADRHENVLYLELPDGEAYKTSATLGLIYDALLSHACDRKTVLYALGGGVVGDIVGYAAATYMRGVPFVQIPTTLLAQVDSSVGGKTAINHPLGKNMIGAFYQPLRVLCDLNALNTLPPRELSAGLAEVIKYGPIADGAFLAWLESNMEALVARQPEALAYAVERSCGIKADVVGRDERESDLRAILNFGHTFGHAIEAGLGYGHWLHGEAVGCGMVMAAALSRDLGVLAADQVPRLTALCQRAGLPVTLSPALGLTPERMVELMQVDKKTEAGRLNFVLVDGERAVVRPVAPEPVLAVIRDNQAQAAALSAG